MYFNNLGWLFNRIYPSMEWKIPVADKKIFLTFDDGPIPDVTEFVLEVLKLYDCKATFFCVGDNLRKYPGVHSKVAAAGHSLGNHTFNHLNGWKTDLLQYIENVTKCQELLHTTGTDKQLFRPPYGKITGKQIAALKDEYRIIMWDVLTGDFDQNLSPDKCLKKSINYTGNGSIVIFHDSIKAERNLKFVLPRFMEHFLAAGYSFDKI